MTIQNKVQTCTKNPSTNRLEVLPIMIDALWLYLRSIKNEDTKDKNLNQKLQNTSQSLYEILSYLEDKNNYITPSNSSRK